MKKLLLLIAILIAAPLYSAEREFALMSLEELMKIKVIGSTLTPESLTVVPSSVTVLLMKRSGAWDWTAWMS